MNTTDMTQPEWREQFKPILNPALDESEQDGAQELFHYKGVELEYVKAVNPNRVWTLLETDGEPVIASGIHYVNRLGFFITEEACPENKLITIH